MTNVTVSGTGLSSGSANVYGDGTWARSGAALANGTNTYTATAQDSYGRQDTSTVSVNLAPPRCRRCIQVAFRPNLVWHPWRGAIPFLGFPGVFAVLRPPATFCQPSGLGAGRRAAQVAVYWGTQERRARRDG
ncbi:exported hypothetical protein [Verrucomicrobia bacterium]|nr:exported hypothetical protein [Verrucomicrobiota bacterium]